MTRLLLQVDQKSVVPSLSWLPILSGVTGLFGLLQRTLSPDFGSKSLMVSAFLRVLSYYTPLWKGTWLIWDYALIKRSRFRVEALVWASRFCKWQCQIPDDVLMLGQTWADIVICSVLCYESLHLTSTYHVGLKKLRCKEAKQLL